MQRVHTLVFFVGAPAEYLKECQVGLRFMQACLMLEETEWMVLGAIR